MSKIYIILLAFLFIYRVEASPIDNDQENNTQKNNSEESKEDSTTDLESRSRTSISNIETMNLFELVKILIELIIKNLGNASAIFTKSIVKALQFMEQQRHNVLEHLNGSFSTSFDNTKNAIEMVANSAQIIGMTFIECSYNQRVPFQRVVNTTIQNLVVCGNSNIRNLVNIIKTTVNLTETAKETLTSVVSRLMNCENVTNNIIEYGFCASNILRNSVGTIVRIVSTGTTLVIRASTAFQTLPTNLAMCASGSAVNFVRNIVKIIGDIGRCVANTIS